ncbi:MAG: hypothetical protein ACUVTL_10410 [Thermoproteota archaeon]
MSHELVPVPPEREDEVQEILVRDVEGVGGAINMSGWYPLLEKHALHLL